MMAYIKTEIKEETADELVESDVPLSDVMKLEENEPDYSEYNQPQDYMLKSEEGEQDEEEEGGKEEESAYSYDYNMKNESKKNPVECENIYIDGEPAVLLTNFNGSVQNHLKDDALDPLAINTPIERQIQRRIQTDITPSLHPAKRICIVSNMKAPPVKDLVNRTYSSKCRKPKSDAGCVCKTCEKIFSDSTQLRNHERICNLKCMNCNLIFQRKEYLTKHMKRCIPGNHSETSIVPAQSRIRNSHRNSKSCNICLVELGSIEELAKHKKENHFVANAYACHVCDRKFDSNLEAVIHLQDTHIQDTH